MPYIFILLLLILSSCLSSNDTINPALRNPNEHRNNANTPQTITQKPSGPFYKGDGGKGIVIVIPTPVMQNNTKTDNWIPQYLQDLITGDMARFSAMTVIDRQNEKLAIAEQNLSASGNYSDDNYIRIGNLTNAQFIVAGNIQNISGRYNLSFRINNPETNEIKASFNKPYPLNDIETGYAAKEAVLELLIGMGIELTEDGKKALLAIQPVEVQATAYLAKGMAAEKSDNTVEALAFLFDALNSNSTRNEANRHIQSFFIDIPTANIRERANYAITQKEKWNKILADLDMYMWKNAPIFIYDFSTVEDKIDIRNSQVQIKITPGVKVIPNRTALLVYKTIVDNWMLLRKNDENKDWIGSVRMPRLSDSGSSTGLYSVVYSYFSAEIGLYDDYEDHIANFRWYGDHPSINIQYFKNEREQYAGVSNFQVMSQRKYYDEAKFCPIYFTIPINKLTDRMIPKIEQITSSKSNQGMPLVEYSIMTVSEWQEWLSLQGTQ
jgi:TolB-like protein